MRTWAVREGRISADRLALFDLLRSDLERLPDLDPSHLVSCHAACRVLASLHPAATCVDGWFAGTGNEHSWLDLGDGIVADMYPIAGAVPFVVDTSHWAVPWGRLYAAKPDLLDAKRLAETEEVVRLLLLSREDDEAERSRARTGRRLALSKLARAAHDD